MNRIRPEFTDSDPSDHSVAADLFLRQVPEEEEDEDEEEDEGDGDGKDDDDNDDTEDHGYSE